METRDITIESFSLKLARTPVIHLADVEKHLVAKTANTTDGRQAIITAMFHGIRRARKECETCGGITLEWLLENVDGQNAPGLIRQFFELNGFAPAKEGSTTGEAVAAAAPPS